MQTYRVTLDITMDPELEGTPDLWDWVELLDLSDPGLISMVQCELVEESCDKTETLPA